MIKIDAVQNHEVVTLTIKIPLSDIENLSENEIQSLTMTYPYNKPFADRVLSLFSTVMNLLRKETENQNGKS